MRLLTAWIEERVLSVRTLEADPWPVSLKGEFRVRTERWQANGLSGKKTLECLPLGMWWMQSQGGTDPYISAVEVFDESRRFHVSMGNLHIHRITGFLSHPESVESAYVPHFKTGEPKRLYAFSRGEEWESLDRIAIQNRR